MVKIQGSDSLRDSSSPSSKLLKYFTIDKLEGYHKSSGTIIINHQPASTVFSIPLVMLYLTPFS